MKVKFLILLIVIILISIFIPNIIGENHSVFIENVNDDKLNDEKTHEETVQEGINNEENIIENELEVTNDESFEEEEEKIYPPGISILTDEIESGIEQAEYEGLLLLAENKSALGYYSNLILARRHDEENKDAALYYASVLDLYYTKEVHLEYAEHLLRIGYKEKAVNEYLTLLSEENILEVLKTLNVSPERIAKALIDKSRWEEAQEYLQPLIQSTLSEDTLYILKKYYARALAEQGEFKKALPFYETFYNSEKTDLSIAWLYGRCLEESDRTYEAKQIYTNLGENGIYRLGTVLKNEGRLMEAADTYSLSSEPVCLWKAARIWDQAGMTEKAIETYIKVAGKYSAYQDDAAYRAYILSSRLGKEENQMLLEVLKEHPAWMARLGKEPLLKETYEINYEKPDYILQAELYEKEGFDEAAKIEVAIGSISTTLEEKLALGEWYLKREEYNKAAIWGVISMYEKPTRKGYELAYPLAYKEIVKAMAIEYNIEAALIWAIIREESSYRHEAISRVGAIGLMQIMPSTGRNIAKSLGISIEDDDLLDPELNIRFGSFLLRELLDTFDNDIDKVNASYNAGPNKTKEWMDSVFGKTKEDFPTAVTYFETQEHITKVADTYHIYKLLLNEE